jgi:Bacteriophage tail sheath protein
MPEYLAPGVYIEEVAFRSSAIEGASTSTTGFVAVTGRGPLLGPLASFTDFERVATPNLGVNLPLAVRGFFENGGQFCFISQVGATDPIESALAAFDNQQLSIICCPDAAIVQNASSDMAAYCEKRKDCFCILDSILPVVPVATHQPPVRSSYAAYYHPWITVPSASGSATTTIPACGHVAGVYAQTDTNRGVWVAPANVPVIGVTALSQQFTAAESDQLNSRGIDLIRNLPTHGITVWGARTTSDDDSDWEYVAVRRYLIFLEQSIEQGVQWAVVEPNGPALWVVVRSSIEDFLATSWKQGALQGSTAQEAFFVRCDATTMTQGDLDNGRLVCIVGVAPVRPAEFVIIQIAIWTHRPLQQVGR